jgi:phosphatidylinositol alpha-1,6-mannosyltransferase
MRLLFVTQDFPPDIGGIQTYSWEVAHRLADRMSSLHVVAPARPESASLDAQSPFSVSRVSGRPDLLLLTALPTVCRQARRQQPDVAFHAQWQTVVTSVVARAVTGWPRQIACAAHGRELLFNPFDGLPGLSALYNRFRRWTLSQVDAALPVSRYTAAFLRALGVPPNRVHVVPNGTDPDRFCPQPEARVRARLGLDDHSVLLTVGRLVPRKGVDTVLHALPYVAEKIPNVTYLVVGTGPDRKRLERLARHLQIQNRVHFLGEVPHDELPDFYSAADLFVMPAREAPPDVEGFGLVFLEANACGTPVVGARTGGIPDAIAEGKTGLLVPAGTPAPLAEALTQLLTDPARLTALGERGRRRAVQEASWDHVVDALFDTLSALSASPG